MTAGRGFPTIHGGWATFHYGRWDYDNVYGWFWVPDDVWGPAWVSWRRSPGYFGWAPLRPGISISIAFGRDYHERNERWTFVRDRDFTRPDMDRRYVDRGNNNSIMKGSTVIVNTQRDDKRNATYITGPARNDVQQITHAAVTPVAIREADKPGHRLSNGELQIYRPQIQRGNGQDPAPARVARLSDLKPASERSAGNRQQQPPTVTQPAQGQPPQAHTVPSLPRNGRQQQQMRMEAPPPQSQPAQQRTVILPAGRGRQQQSRAVSPGQPVQPKAVTPSDGKGNPQQAPTVIPPNRGQSPRPLTIDPSRGRGLEKQTQNVPLPKKVDQTQPTKNKEEKSKQDEKPKQRE